MKIVQLSEEARPFSFSYIHNNNNNNNGYSSDDSSHQQESWKEDDTCVQLCIQMPGVKAQDIRLCMKDSCTLRVWGQLASCGRGKRQRLNVREFPIDTQLLDVQRAIATVYKDTLVLYAPKKRNTFSKSSLLEELETTTRSKVLSPC